MKMFQFLCKYQIFWICVVPLILFLAEVNIYPWFSVQVDEDDFYDGPDESEYDSDDSNGNFRFSSFSFLNSKCLHFFFFLLILLWWFSAENNPLHDYPDEISEEEVESSEASENESEESESENNRSLKSEDLDQHGLLDDAELSENESEKESEIENNRSLKPEDLDQHDSEIDDHFNYGGDDFDYTDDDDDDGHDDEGWR